METVYIFIWSVSIILFWQKRKSTVSTEDRIDFLSKLLEMLNTMKKFG